MIIAVTTFVTRLFFRERNSSEKDSLYHTTIWIKHGLFCRSAPLSEVQDWLKTVPTLGLEPVKCGNNSLDEPVVEAIEEAVRKTKVNSTVPLIV